VPFPREEVEATVARYHGLRDRIDAGLEPDAFGALADFYTEDVVVKWTQVLPRTCPDGTPYRQSAYSRLVYAGDGKFSYEEDLYNMTHVMEDIVASGWQPNGPMNAPPVHPDRNFDV